MDYRVKKVELVKSANPAVEDAFRLSIENTTNGQVDTLDVPFVDGEPPDQAAILAVLCDEGYSPNDLGACA